MGSKHSFKHALNGIKYAWHNEINIRIQLIIGILAIITAYFLNLNKIDFIIILFCITIVVASEMMNTAVEKICDFISPGIDQRIKIIKDIAAGTVLIVSLASSIIGLIIFYKYIVIIY
ncbi:MAG: diacylglycerol kinase family protein [Saprospiraceae bacterium]